MTDRVVPRPPRRVGLRTVVAVFSVVTVLALGGLCLDRATERSRAVAAAPKTAAVQHQEASREVQAEIDASGSGVLPGVRDCGLGEPELEPEIITLACANEGTVASGIKWEEYEAEQAEGSGVVQVSGGASGAARTSFPARFVLHSPKNVNGQLAFTSLEVRYTGMTPAGKATETYSI